jgi:error-prone DNA polymerase
VGGGQDQRRALVVGCRLDLTDGMSILVYPTDRAAYSRLTGCCPRQEQRGGKGKCLIDFADVSEAYARELA